MDYSLLVGIHFANEEESLSPSTLGENSSDASAAIKLSKSPKPDLMEESISEERGNQSSPSSTDPLNSSSISNSESPKSSHKRTQSIVQTSFPLPSEFKYYIHLFFFPFVF